MTKHYTSTAVKQRYNEKAYRKLTIQVKPELAARIAAYREREGLSMAKFLERAVDVLEQGETV